MSAEKIMFLHEMLKETIFEFLANETLKQDLILYLLEKFSHGEISVSTEDLLKMREKYSGFHAKTEKDVVRFKVEKEKDGDKKGTNLH